MNLILICVGALFALSIMLLLNGNLLKLLFGMTLMSSVINLAIFLCGRSENFTPAFINATTTAYANPLIQAMVLTAIVIGFGFIALLASLLRVILPANRESEL